MALSNPKEASVTLKSQDNSEFPVEKKDIQVASDAKTPETALTVTVLNIGSKYAKAGTKATVTVTTAAGTSNSVVFTLQ
jgi:hypothetical protein